ncbi:hypothetical protein HMPREF0102_01102 [Bacteroides sp. 2_1_22]|nr:hypothetical protein HMPREF0102_01102 [Bacteroides sp. 2_1_22]
MAGICCLYFLNSLSFYIVYKKEFPVNGNSFFCSEAALLQPRNCFCPILP